MALDASPADARDVVLDLLGCRERGHCLPGPMYSGPQAYGVDLQHIWYREWVFAGHEGELAETGAYLTLTVGEYPILVVRGDDGVVRALHNVCRHRGSLLCDAASGRVRRKIVCPYHQWAYDLDGSFFRAPTGQELDAAGLGLRPAHCTVVGGLVFVCPLRGSKLTLIPIMTGQRLTVSVVTTAAVARAGWRGLR